MLLQLFSRRLAFVDGSLMFCHFVFQEARFPPGVILEIRMYLDKGKRAKSILILSV